MKSISKFLTEAFIGKHNINKVNTGMCSTVEKSKFHTGDLLFLSTGEVGLFVKSTDVRNPRSYKGIHIVEKGSMIHPDDDFGTFSGLEIKWYNEDGTGKLNGLGDIIGVMSSGCPRSVYMDPDQLWSYLKDLEENNKNRFK